jgi:hypothetical protein
MLRFVSIAALAVAAVFAFGSPDHPQFRDLHDKLLDPFASPAHARVFLLVRTDCPITNRYAPELHRIAAKYKGTPVDFWLVYPDPAERAQSVKKHLEQYQFPGTAIFDPRHQLVRLAHATVAPEAAVFDRAGRLTYHGRIDDLYVSIGRSRPGGPQTHDLEDAIASTLQGKPVLHPETRAVGCSLADIE